MRNYKVITICEITGRVNTLADNLTVNEAIALVKDNANKDELVRVVKVKKW